jgi:hypothetical protein
MVYADGSNPSVRKDIGVRLPSPALHGSRAGVVRRTERRRSSSASDDELAGLRERSARAERGVLKRGADAADADHVGVAGDPGRGAGDDHHPLAFGESAGLDQRPVDLADHVVGVADHRDHE